MNILSIRDEEYNDIKIEDLHIVEQMKVNETNRAIISGTVITPKSRKGVITWYLEGDVKYSTRRVSNKISQIDSDKKCISVLQTSYTTFSGSSEFNFSIEIANYLPCEIDHIFEIYSNDNSIFNGATYHNVKDKIVPIKYLTYIFMYPCWLPVQYIRPKPQNISESTISDLLISNNIKIDKYRTSIWEAKEINQINPFEIRYANIQELVQEEEIKHTKINKEMNNNRGCLNIFK